MTLSRRAAGDAKAGAVQRTDGRALDHAQAAKFLARLCLSILCFADLASGVQAQPAGGPRSEARFRFAFSANLLREFNENDAKAAMRVWVETLAKERSIKADPIVKVFTNVESLGQALRERGVDGVVLPIDQFWVLGGSAVFNRCIFPMRGGDLSETYVLLVHAESGISQIEQLKGRSCTVLDHSRMALANAWLSVLLAKKGLGLPSECFAQLSSFNKLSKVVLPVFFRQTDACLVTSQGFKTMTELNPQLGKALRVVISSPAIIPTGFFFRKGDELESQSRMVTELSRIHSTPAGQQVLTVFQTDRLEEKPLSCLDDSLRILAEFDGLAGRAAGSQSAELVVRPGPAGEGTR